MNTLRSSKAGVKLALASLLAGFALVAAPHGAADALAATKSEAATSAARSANSAAPQARSAAVPAKAADPAAIAAKRAPQYTSANGAGTPTDAGCLRQRKRLWVEGDGWLVRKVTVCP